MAKDAYYFPHDSNAKDDPKCVLLIEQLGMEGYGIYWVLVETLRDQPGYRYPIALIPALARRYNTQAAKLEAVVTNYGLFKIMDGDFFYSESLDKRMIAYDSKRDKARLAGQKSGEVRKLIAFNGRSTDVQRTFSERSTDVEPEEKRREEKSRREDIKDSLSDDKPPDEPQYNPDVDPLNRYHQAAVHFSEMVLKANPTCKVPKEGTEAMGKWAREIRLMFESDKRDREHVKETLTFCFEKDSFWAHTCQSPANFRKNFDKIRGKMLASSKQETRKPINSYERSVLALHNWAQNGGGND